MWIVSYSLGVKDIDWVQFAAPGFALYGQPYALHAYSTSAFQIFMRQARKQCKAVQQGFGAGAWVFGGAGAVTFFSRLQLKF